MNDPIRLQKELFENIQTDKNGARLLSRETPRNCHWKCEIVKINAMMRIVDNSLKPALGGRLLRDINLRKRNMSVSRNSLAKCKSSPRIESL